MPPASCAWLQEQDLGYELPFADRMIATLAIMRFQLPHAALAVFYDVHRSTAKEWP